MTLQELRALVERRVRSLRSKPLRTHERLMSWMSVHISCMSVHEHNQTDLDDLPYAGISPEKQRNEKQFNAKTSPRRCPRLSARRHAATRHMPCDNTEHSTLPSGTYIAHVFDTMRRPTTQLYIMPDSRPLFFEI